MLPVCFDFQRSAAAWLASRRRAYLADVPGLGKTRTLVTAMRQLPGFVTPLVLCPASAIGRWEEELGDVRATLLSYDRILRPGTVFPSAPLSLLICDEAHRLKSPDALRTQVVLGRTGLLRRAERVWFASGTPMPNHPGELFTILATAFPERLRELRIPSYPVFESLFVEKQAWDRQMKRFVSAAEAARRPWHITWQITGVKNAPTLDRLLFGVAVDRQPAVMLRRTWDSPEVLREMAAMPPVLWQYETVHDDGPERVPMYLDALRDFERGDIEALRIIPASMRQQVGLQKVAMVARAIADEVGEARSARVVFAYHRGVLDELERMFGRDGIRVLRVDGSTPIAERHAAERAFQAAEGPVIFLGQNDAAKESLTLTRADRVDLVEPSFVVDDNTQMVGRIRRHGQTSQKLVARIWGLARSYDQRIAQILARKQQLKEEVGL